LRANSDFLTITLPNTSKGIGQGTVLRQLCFPGVVDTRFVVTFRHAFSHFGVVTTILVKPMMTSMMMIYVTSFSEPQTLF